MVLHPAVSQENKEKSLDIFLPSYLRSRLGSQITVMKNYIDHITRAHLLRGTLYLLLLLAACLVPFTFGQRQPRASSLKKNPKHRAYDLPLAPAGGVYAAWISTYNGGAAQAIAVDDLGNVYVTGASGGYVTIKYDSAGQQQWVARYTGPLSSGRSQSYCR